MHFLIKRYTGKYNELTDCQSRSKRKTNNLSVISTISFYDGQNMFKTINVIVDSFVSSRNANTKLKATRRKTRNSREKIDKSVCVKRKRSRFVICAKNGFPSVTSYI